MDDYALVLNAGSSSLKFSVFRRPREEKWLLESQGQIEGIGNSARLMARDTEGQSVADCELGVLRNGHAAIDALARWLKSQYGGSRVLGVGHRVVHGGTKYDRPAVIDRNVLTDLYQLVPLAPLHQPYNLAAIEAVFERLPNVPQVACFDTSFHQSHSDVVKVVPLPLDIRKTGVQRYGFHGLSYEYVASMLPQVAPEIAHGKVIVAHLGSGASLCAMREGKSVDTTMSFTAVDGLCMGTRPGAIDPGIVLYLFQNLKLSTREVESLLYKKSGLLGISGVSNDMRVLLPSDAPAARLAVSYFIYRLSREIAGLAGVLGGIDALVFTAGIGENSPEIRRRICHACSWLGLELDAAANDVGASRISSAESRVSAWIVPTNEELIIARHTGMLLGLVEPAVSRVA